MAFPFIGSLAFFDWCKSLNCQQQDGEDGEGGVISIVGMHAPRYRKASDTPETHLLSSAANADGFREILDTAPGDNSVENTEGSSCSSVASSSSTGGIRGRSLRFRSSISQKTPGSKSFNGQRGKFTNYGRIESQYNLFPGLNFLSARIFIFLFSLFLLHIQFKSHFPWFKRLV
ncbi:unnamed protein product [Enterobius vermicularis]|uniref:Uncharacterized protein n=1 Tax=Enterobius vermicularis TaxID=51028 RepID=A0A0N4VQK5_ENTVE|nr:unnamed protein product [Enterobius vermicularis]